MQNFRSDGCRAVTFLGEHFWWISALFGSFCAAVYYTANQYFRMPWEGMVFWRSLTPLVAFTPALFLIEWPEQPLFYVLPLISACFCLVADSRNMTGAMRFGGGVTTRLKPFSVWILFALWFAVDHDYRAALLADPLKAGIILALVCAASLITFRLARCAVSKDAMIFFMPALLASVGINFLVKCGMDLSPLFSGIVLFPWIEALALTVFLVLKSLGTGSKVSFGAGLRMFFPAGLVIGLSMTLMIIAKNIAFTYTPNPAYAVAIVMTAPFWVSLFYLATGQSEKADVRNGLFFVVTSIILVLVEKGM